MNFKRRVRLLLLILLLQVTVAVSLSSANLLKMVRASQVYMKERALRPKETFVVLGKFTFSDKNSLAGWEEKVFKGRTFYKVLSDNERSFLKSSSQGASSGLYKKIDQRVTPDLHLAWKWRAITFPQKKEPGKLASRGQDDFAARIYLVFPGSNLWNSRVIEYIWDEKIPEGTVASSPFSGNVKLFVIRSGKAAEGDEGWQKEDRNIYEDYVKLFGEKPTRSLQAIALMSDSDNTKTNSESDFGDIILTLRQRQPELWAHKTQSGQKV